MDLIKKPAGKNTKYKKYIYNIINTYYFAINQSYKIQL